MDRLFGSVVPVKALYWNTGILLCLFLRFASMSVGVLAMFESRKGTPNSCAGQLFRFRNWFIALVIADTKDENINMPERIIPEKKGSSAAALSLVELE